MISILNIYYEYCRRGREMIPSIDIISNLSENKNRYNGQPYKAYSIIVKILFDNTSDMRAIFKCL